MATYLNAAHHGWVKMLYTGYFSIFEALSNTR